MADIPFPWNGLDKAPEHNQLIIASIGEPGFSVPPKYLVATYQQYGDEAYLSYPTFAEFAGQGQLPFRYVLAWQPLNIQQLER
jgi:hypothetical protein